MRVLLCARVVLLGLQIDYSTVFFFEYLGPMLIYPLFFLFPSVIYGQ